MILQIGTSGFTASRVFKLLKNTSPNTDQILGMSRVADPSNQVEEFNWESLKIKIAQIKTLIYTPSPYLGKIPSLVSFLEENNFKGHLVVFSSAALYTSIPPHKRQWLTDAEETVMKSKIIDWTIIRPNLIYGSKGDGNFERLFKLVKLSPVIPLPGSGTNLIQPIHVDDLVEILGKVIKEKKKGILELAGPRPRSYKELIKIIGKTLGKPAVIMPIPFVKTLNSLLWLKKHWFWLDLKTQYVRVDQIERFSESRVLAASCSQEFLNRPMIDLEEGLAREFAGMVLKIS